MQINYLPSHFELIWPCFPSLLPRHDFVVRQLVEVTKSPHVYDLRWHSAVEQPPLLVTTEKIHKKGQLALRLLPIKLREHLVIHESISVGK